MEFDMDDNGAGAAIAAIGGMGREEPSTTQPKKEAESSAEESKRV
jgi:hypothetical protein